MQLNYKDNENILTEVSDAVTDLEERNVKAKYFI